MSVIYLLLAASLVVALVFLALFIKAVREGQFDDTWSPSRRMLNDDVEPVNRETGTAEGNDISGGADSRPPLRQHEKARKETDT